MVRKIGNKIKSPKDATNYIKKKRKKTRQNKNKTFWWRNRSRCSILPYQVWPSDYQSDLDNRCVWSRYKMRGASNMNIHYDVTGLLTAVWRSHSGQIVWAAWINCELAREEKGGGGFWAHSTYTGYPGSAGGRQLDRWRCVAEARLLGVTITKNNELWSTYRHCHC